MNLTERLNRLTERHIAAMALREALIAKRAELIGKHKSAEVVEHELVLVTAKVLKFERRVQGK